MIVRGDTLERNPGFMNPQEMTTGPQLAESSSPEPEKEAFTHVKIENVNRQQMIFNQDTGVVTVIETTDVDQGQWHHHLSSEDAVAMASGINSSPTGANPADKIWPGDHGFKMNFMKLSQNARNKSWDVSQ